MDWPPKYGKRVPPYEEWDDEHSGFTPTGLRFPQLVNQPDQEELDDREDFQMRHLKAFSVQSLIDVDAFPSRQLKDGNLNINLHPILERECWEKISRPEAKRRGMYLWAYLEPEIVSPPQVRLRMYNDTNISKGRPQTTWCGLCYNLSCN